MPFRHRVRTSASCSHGRREQNRKRWRARRRRGTAVARGRCAPAGLAIVKDSCGLLALLRQPLLCQGLAQLLLLANALVPLVAPPVGAVVVGMDDLDVWRGLPLGLANQHHGLPLVDHRHLAPGEMAPLDDDAERRESLRVVLDDLPIVDAEDLAVGHVPPAHRVHLALRAGHPAIRRLEIAPVSLLGHVGGEPVARLVCLGGVRVLDGRGLQVHRRVEAHLGAARGLVAHVVVDGEDAQLLAVALEEPRLPPVVAGRRGTDDPDLHEGAGAHHGDGVLELVAQVEVPREPGLHLWVLLHEAQEDPRLLRRARVVEPRAAVPDVHVLEHPEARAHGRRVGDHDDAPALVRRVRLQGLPEPVYLGRVDVDLVRGEGAIPEARGGEAHEEGLVRDLPGEVGGVEGEDVHPGLQVARVRVELVEAL
mmetsp:Transcript_27545/g.92096  ORF Transcript_27545/g.92096 Transcript_27545/m.92096 type:complete len:423 (-) Transcript_27545:502-1770(-)